jgi:hypothetical protein
MRGLLTAMLLVLTVPAAPAGEPPSQPLHPAYRLLDDDGRNVRESGGPGDQRVED